MAYDNRLKAVLIACLIMLGAVNFATADGSYGQIIAQFVMSPFAKSGIFTDIKTTGQSITGEIKNAIPTSQIQDWLKKIRVTVMILKILKATEAPKHIDLEKYFDLIRQVAASDKDFSSMVDEIKSAVLDYTKFGNNKDLSYTNGGFTAGAGSVAGLNLLPEGNSSLISANANLGLSESNLGVSKNVSQSLNIGSAPNLDSIGSKLGMDGTDGKIDDDNGKDVLNIMEKFLNMILENSKYISKVGEAVDKIDAVTDVDKLATDQIAGFINEKGDKFLSKYGITNQDISLAQNVVEGKYNPTDFDDIKQIISMLGKGNSTVETFGKLVDLCKETQNMNDISEDTAMKLLVKVVNLFPATAAAVDKIKL